MQIACTDKTVGLIIRFRIQGTLRFLSHAETMTVFKRAFARAGIILAHSYGFNPHPKLSLPLPRSVGVESDDELLCVEIEKIQQIASDSKHEVSCSNLDVFKKMLFKQLPEGCEIISAEISENKLSLQPTLATYMISLRDDFPYMMLKENIGRLLESKSLIISRAIHNTGKTKNIDVRGFLKSIEFDDININVKSRITPTGSIRIEEILSLLEIKTEDLKSPVKRINVQWNGLGNEN